MVPRARCGVRARTNNTPRRGNDSPTCCCSATPAPATADIVAFHRAETVDQHARTAGASSPGSTPTPRPHRHRPPSPPSAPVPTTPRLTGSSERHLPHPGHRDHHHRPPPEPAPDRPRGIAEDAAPGHGQLLGPGVRGASHLVALGHTPRRHRTAHHHPRRRRQPNERIRSGNETTGDVEGDN